MLLAWFYVLPGSAEADGKINYYTVSQKRPTFTTCYNFYICSSIAAIFGTYVAVKVGNQNVLYFPASPN